MVAQSVSHPPPHTPGKPECRCGQSTTERSLGFTAQRKRGDAKQAQGRTDQVTDERTDHQLVDVSLYRALPITQTQPVLTTNLGWSLLDLQTPTTARSSESITITHVWRVDDLPSEDFLHWYFAPFVKLIAPDGKTIVDVNGAPAIEGYRWLRGWIMVSTIHINLPADLAKGDYTLELSLFDPNQKKNAVYFDPVASDKPIVTIHRRIAIQ